MQLQQQMGRVRVITRYGDAPSHIRPYQTVGRRVNGPSFASEPVRVGLALDNLCRADFVVERRYITWVSRLGLHGFRLYQRFRRQVDTQVTVFQFWFHARCTDSDPQ